MNGDRQRLLEHQADTLERKLTEMGAPCSISGGTVGPRIIAFHAHPDRGVRVASVQRLAADLAVALHVDTLSVEPDAGGLTITIARADAKTVDFLSLLDATRDSLRPGVATIGLTPEGAPLLVNLRSADVAHILVAGTTGSGKSVLLRTLLASLVLTHKPVELLTVTIDAKGRAFRPFAGLPHLVRPPLSDPGVIREALRSLVHLMELRDRRGESRPDVVVVIDELADVVMTCDGAVELLTRLTQRGREAGIHVVAATQYPSAAILGGLMRANFPLRLVGRVASADDARVATGRAGSQAHQLTGHGDFLAVHGGTHYRFQVAYAAPDALEAELALTRSLARPGTYALPPAPDEAAEVGEKAWLEAGVATLLDNWEWWTQMEGQWGSKRQLHDLLFPGKPYGGTFVDQASAILDATRARINTTTTRPPRAGSGFQLGSQAV